MPEAGGGDTNGGKGKHQHLAALSAFATRSGGWGTVERRSASTRLSVAGAMGMLSATAFSTATVAGLTLACYLHFSTTPNQIQARAAPPPSTRAGARAPPTNAPMKGKQRKKTVRRLHTRVLDVHQRRIHRLVLVVGATATLVPFSFPSSLPQIDTRRTVGVSVLGESALTCSDRWHNCCPQGDVPHGASFA